MNYQGSTCICRVPKTGLKKGLVVECVHCGECLMEIKKMASEVGQGHSEAVEENNMLIGSAWHRLLSFHPLQSQCDIIGCRGCSSDS